MDSDGLCDIRALAELLKPDGNESPDSDEDLPNAGLTKLGTYPCTPCTFFFRPFICQKIKLEKNFNA